MGMFPAGDDDGKLREGVRQTFHDFGIKINRVLGNIHPHKH